jgi:hypothetical protein
MCLTAKNAIFRVEGAFRKYRGETRRWLGVEGSSSTLWIP